MAIIRAEHAKTERSIHQYMKLLGEWDYEEKWCRNALSINWRITRSSWLKI
jgi:hypothetical protein